MSPRPTIDQRIESFIYDLDELAEDLPRFDELSITEQDVWLYEFSNTMSKIVDLERSYERGEMTPEQEERYRVLKAKFNELAPGIREVLELSVPEELLY